MRGVGGGGTVEGGDCWVGRKKGRRRVGPQEAFVDHLTKSENTPPPDIGRARSASG